MHVITAGTSAMQNIQTCVARCHLDVTDFVASPYASGLGSLVEDELDLGVTVIDMGGGTTSIAVFFDGALVYTDGVPVGVGHEIGRASCRERVGQTGSVLVVADSLKKKV